VIRVPYHRGAERGDCAHSEAAPSYPKEPISNQFEPRADDSLPQLCRKIPLDDIQVGDCINYSVRLKGMFCLNLGQIVTHITRADGGMALIDGPNGIATAFFNDGVLRVWWIITEDGPVAPGSVLAVYRISPDCRAASCPWCSGRPGQPVLWGPRA